MIKVVWAVVVGVLAMLGCFFIAGNFEVFAWDAGERFVFLLVTVFAFGATITCPIFKEL